MSRRERSVADWEPLTHHAIDCRGTWVVEVGQPFRHDEFESAVAVRAYCKACDALHQLRAFTPETDDPQDDEPLPWQHTPLLSHSERIASHHIPELHTLRVAGIELRGRSLFPGSPHEPYTWDAFVDGERVGAVGQYSTARYAKRWAWGIGPAGSVTSSQNGYKTARAAAKGLAGALAADLQPPDQETDA